MTFLGGYFLCMALSLLWECRTPGTEANKNSTVPSIIAYTFAGIGTALILGRW